MVTKVATAKRAPTTAKVVVPTQVADVVLVHGVGSQTPGWSRRAIDQNVQAVVGSYLNLNSVFNWNFIEDNWSTPAPAPAPARTALAFKAEDSNQFAQTLLSVFAHRSMTTLDPRTLAGYAKSLALDLTHNLTEVMSYILSGSTNGPADPNGFKEQAKQELQDKVMGATSGTIDVISHSWGTIVAYEMLSDPRLNTNLPTIRNWVTLASPLWVIAFLQGDLAKLFLDTPLREKPSKVDTWINAWAQGDVAGNRLTGIFAGVGPDVMLALPPDFTGDPHGVYFDYLNPSNPNTVNPPAPNDITRLWNNTIVPLFDA